MIQLSDFYGYSMYTISSDTLSVSVMSLGATVTKLAYLGRNVVVSLKTPDDYLQDTSYLGAIVGRYANRIAGGRFPLNGKTVQIEQNEGRNHLHGGSVGFHKRIWAAECLGEQAVRFTLHTPDGDAGYPGALTMHVTYRVEGSRLFLDFEGVSTKDTILAPTTHMYFNLGGTESILGTTLQINASRWIPVDGELIPTGELRPAEGPFDFRTPHTIAQNFDHGFVLDGPDALVAEDGGVRLSLHTDYPALQLYTGEFLSGKLHPNQGFAIEPEACPDTPNHPEFGSSVLKAGETFHRSITYTFESTAK